MNKTVSPKVIEQDHTLDRSHERSTEELARHRWHNIEDQKGPHYTLSEYAAAVGRSPATIQRHVLGYMAYKAQVVQTRSLEDCFRLVQMKEEDQAIACVIADAQGVPVSRVARGDNRHKMYAIKGQAQERAERRGTDLLDEVREVVNDEIRNRHHKSTTTSVTAHLSAALQRLTKAINEGTDLPDEEMKLIQQARSKVRSALNMIDLRRMIPEGTDWDAEAAALEKTGSDK